MLPETSLPDPQAKLDSFSLKHPPPFHMSTLLFSHVPLLCLSHLDCLTKSDSPWNWDRVCWKLARYKNSVCIFVVISCLNKELLEHLNNQSSEGISVWHAAEWFTWETSKKCTQTLQATPWEYCKSQMQRLVLWHLETVSFNQKDCIASNPTKKQWS